MDPNDVAATVRLAASGDRMAWDALVESFGRMLWGVASGYRLGRADTAEVVQTTWLRLVEHLDRIKQPEAVGGWLATTARHEALRMLRLRGRELPTDDDAQLDREPSREPRTGPEEQALTADRNRRLWDAFEHLPENCRTLLRLLVVDTPPYAQVAAELDMPIGSIGPTRSRCLERLRRLLAGEVGEMNQPVDRDDQLLAELADALRVYDGPPEDVITAAKELFTWRTVDAELASLVFDSLLDDEPAAVRSTAVAPRVLTFEADGLAVEVEVDPDPERRLVGQLVPAQIAELELITPQGTVRTTADDLGRFVVPLPADPCRVTLRVVAGAGRVVTAIAVI